MNTIISTLMECMNNLMNYWKEHPGRIHRESVEEYIRLMAPVAPHIAEELWRHLGHKNSVFDERWPEFNPDFIKQDNMMIVVQVNGKLRDKMMVPADADQETVEKMALSSEKVKASLVNGGQVRKVIYVPGRIVNVVVK
jgi:leucyl-tRNA synthetase